MSGGDDDLPTNMLTFVNFPLTFVLLFCSGMTNIIHDKNVNDDNIEYQM